MNPRCSRELAVWRREVRHFKSDRKVISGAFCCFFSTERWNKSVRMRPGQRCGSRGRCVLRRLHLPNCKTLRGGSWEGAYTETVRGTDCNFPQEWHGLTDCRGKQEATKVAWVYVSFGQWFKVFRVTCTQLKYRVALNVTILIFAIFVFCFCFHDLQRKVPAPKKVFAENNSREKLFRKSFLHLRN